jgi:hypothetical protein
MMRLPEEDTMLSLDELGHGLLKTPKGVFILKCYISDVLEQAKLAGKRDKVKRLDLQRRSRRPARALTRVIVPHYTHETVESGTAFCLTHAR